MSDDLRERIAEMRQAKQVMDEYQINSSFPIWPRHKYEAITATLAPALADEVERLRAALLVLANWQVERRPGGSGEMCDFAADTLKGATRDA